MRQPVLVCLAHLRERSTVAVGRNEQGVVAEAALALLVLCDPTLADTLHGEFAAVRPNDHRDGPEPRRALPERNVGEHAEHFAAVVGVAAALAGEAGGVDTRFATERVDLQSGVVADRRDPRRRAHRSRLQTGVADQGRRVLDDIGHVGRARQQFDNAVEQGRDLGDLVRVRRRAHESVHVIGPLPAELAERRRRRDHLRLESHDLGQPAFGQGEHLIEFAAAERRTLGRALHLAELGR